MTSGNTTGPLPSPFNRLVGTWRVQRHVDVNERMLEGDVAFTPLFSGQAVQDVWTVPAEDALAGVPPDGGFRGTTIYYFDDAPGVLNSAWIDPDQHVTLRFVGRMDASGFDLTSIDDRIHARWHLQLTTESTATWHAYRGDSADGPWTLWEVMQLTRIVTT